MRRTNAVRVVAVGGSFLAASIWQLVADAMAVHDVPFHVVELAGLGRRAAAARPGITLADHVADVVRALARQSGPHILVAHSYGGVPALIAAHYALGRPRAASPLRGALLVGGMVPQPGRSLFDDMPHSAAVHLRKLAAQHDGWRIPVMTDEQMDDWGRHGLTDSDRAFLRVHANPHPLQTYEDRVPDNLCRLGDLPKTYLRLSGDPFRPPVDGAEPSWAVRAFDGGHWPMITQPEDFADVIREFRYFFA